MKKLRVALDKRSYDIVIGENLLGQAASYIGELCHPRRVMVVTDTTVEALHAPHLLGSLQSAGYETKLVSLAPGEGSKSLANVEKLYDEAMSFGMTRTDLAIALGGGVIGDLTGFFAATLFRGIPFIQIPTTLLSQVDSSVGGKTGVNVPSGKNLVGSFYQPKLVLIDTNTLQTLPDKDFSDGMAEVIKYGCIMDAPLFDKLDAAGDRAELLPILSEVIYACCDAKRQVVEEDELDTGKRMILNFGHTIGHVIEKTYGFGTYTHGQAVAAGMVYAAKLGENLGITALGTAQKVIDILRKYALPTELSLPKGWEEALLLDKKMQGKDLSFVLISQIGASHIRKMSAEELVRLLKEM